MKNISIRIAGYHIKLSSGNLPLESEPGYRSFIIPEIAQPDVLICCKEGIPDTVFDMSQPVFEAENEEQKFYSIYKTDHGLGFVIYNQQNKTEIQQIATLDAGYREWTVYSRPTQAGTLQPLRYPMGPIIMHYLTVNTDAIMIHASCVFDGTKGRIFTGFSGAGKSTISGIWAAQGHLLVNDDRLIIRREGDNFFVHNTPMYYEDVPKRVPLHSIFLISHSPENRIRRVTGATAVSKVLAFCIQNNFDRYFISNNLKLISDVCAKTDIYELGFVPDSNVIDFILDNEAER